MTFALQVEAAGDIDGALGELREVRLMREAGSLLLMCDAVDPVRVIALLARAGVTATTAEPACRPAHRAAIVTHLAPLGDVQDVLMVRRAPLGEAVDLVRAATRDLLRRRSEERRTRVGALLAGEDVMLLWRRVAYGPAAVLRRLPGAHPVVFDRGAAEHTRERMSFASQHALAWWCGS